MPSTALTDDGLPTWPVGLLLAAFPVWWALGLAWCSVVLCALVMLTLLVQRRRVELPPGFGLWAAFLLFVMAAVTELDSTLRVLGYLVRMSNYVGAAIVFVYVYNARSRLTDTTAFAYVAAFFAAVVAGGWLGVLLPHGSLSTVGQQLLPASIASNSYVAAFVHPAFSELQQPYGSPVAFARPSAPFPYTNSWGCNAALLLPLMIGAVVLAGRGARRRLYLLLLILAVVPAAATLNRGMFLALGFALVYSAAFFAVRGRPAAVGALLVLGTGGYLAAGVTGVTAQLDTRLQYSQSNQGRVGIYREAWEGALRSPLLGNGAPRPSSTLDISIGTQGQIWNVMFCYGFPALVLFLGFFLYAAVSSGWSRGPAGPWLHVTLMVTLLTLVYYGYDGPQLSVAMLAAALALRPVTGRPGPEVPAAAVGRHAADVPMVVARTE